MDTLIRTRTRRVTRGKDSIVARFQYQTGCLFKRGKRNKVWVARWRESVILENGQSGRIHRSEILGNVRDYPTRREAQLLVENRLHRINMGRQRPKALKPFRDYVQGEWTRLVVPS